MHSYLEIESFYIKPSPPALKHSCGEMAIKNLINKASVYSLSLPGVGSVISGRADEREKFITSNNRRRSYRSGLNMKNVDVEG